MNTVKVLLLVSCICLQAFTSKAFDENDLDDTDKKCIEELKFDKSVVINGYDEDDFIKVGNSQFNQFYACAWKKDHLQNDDGSINPPQLANIVAVKLEKLFPGSENANYRLHLATKSTEACQDHKGSDNGDTAVKIYNCILGKVSELAEQVTPEKFNQL